MNEPKRDCKFYYGRACKEMCTALKGLYCAHGKCNFYKSVVKGKPQDEKKKENA
jgi:hypothetical protein